VDMHAKDLVGINDVTIYTHTAVKTSSLVCDLMSK
jgi:hypothetical protein